MFLSVLASMVRRLLNEDCCTSPSRNLMLSELLIAICGRSKTQFQRRTRQYEISCLPDCDAARKGLKIASPGRRFPHTSCSFPFARLPFAVSRGVFMRPDRVHVEDHLMPCRTVESARSGNFVWEVSLQFSVSLLIRAKVTTT